jgi:hypothetical protein
MKDIRIEKAYGLFSEKMTYGKSNARFAYIS